MPSNLLSFCQVRAEQIGCLALASFTQSKLNESASSADCSRDHLFGSKEFVMRIANLWVKTILQDDAACVRLRATEAVRDVMTALETPERQEVVLENALNTLCGKHKQSSTFSLRQTAIRLIHQLSLTDTPIVNHNMWKRCMFPFFPLRFLNLTTLQALRATHRHNRASAHSMSTAVAQRIVSAGAGCCRGRVVCVACRCMQAKADAA